MGIEARDDEYDGTGFASWAPRPKEDLAMALVGEDLGHQVPRDTARLMVVYQRRAGGQSQHSTLLDLDAASDRVQKALAFAKENLTKHLSMSDLAGVACLSPRQFGRVFREETGHTPAKAVELLRVESARTLMESGRFSVDEVARKNGFVSRDRMRRSFIRSFGQSPQAMQRLLNTPGPLVTPGGA